MAELLVIADDFTGALDSGVQFSARGAAARVLTSMGDGFAGIDGDVLIFDAETRHLPKQEAYERIHRAVELGLEAGVSGFYLKTDSGLRGNVGASLAAVMDAAGASSLVFAPAFPAMNRVTRGGVQYVDGVPLAESVFGRDPLNPVRLSDVRAIIAGQTDKEVHLRSPGEVGSEPGIQLYDAETDSDLERVARGADLRLAAGCAGFASALAGALGIQGKPPEVPELPKALFVVCGSVNPVTRGQLNAAEGYGFLRVCLSREDRLNPRWPGSKACRQRAAEWLALSREHKRMVLDANDPRDDLSLLRVDAEREGLTLREASRVVADGLAGVTGDLLDQGLDAVLMCVGGDTLMALMRTLGISELTPLLEMERGVVLTSFAHRGGTQYILTKSGGFGEPDLLCRLADRIVLPSK